MRGVYIKGSPGSPWSPGHLILSQRIFPISFDNISILTCSRPVPPTSTLVAARPVLASLRHNHGLHCPWLMRTTVADTAHSQCVDTESNDSENTDEASVLAMVAFTSGW